MPGLVPRLRELLEGPLEPEPGHWADALQVAYQHRISWLHEIRAEADQVASQRRRIAVGLGVSPNQAARASAAVRDRELAERHRTLVELAAGTRAQLEQLRAEREAILNVGDAKEAARRAREALQRWRAASEGLLHLAEDRFAEPSGQIADHGEPGTYEQPPGPR